MFIDLSDPKLECQSKSCFVLKLVSIDTAVVFISCPTICSIIRYVLIVLGRSGAYSITEAKGTNRER